MNLALASYALWWREQVRFFRQGSRVFGAFVQPLIFWALFGSGLRASFKAPVGGGQMGYLEYFFPGTMVMILLFTAIFSTISVIEDRREGFLQGVLVAPVPRSAVVLGKVMGGTTLAVLQGTILLALAPLAGIHLTAITFSEAVALQLVVAFALTALSFCIAWRMESTQGFHAIMTLFLMPLWLLSGAFFPAKGVPAWLGLLMKINPLTYGVAAMRQVLYPGDLEQARDLPPFSVSIAVTMAFAAAAFFVASLLARRRGKDGR
jgi:ABC-2 type transport system permease protein